MNGNFNTPPPFWMIITRTYCWIATLYKSARYQIRQKRSIIWPKKIKTLQANAFIGSCILVQEKDQGTRMSYVVSSASQLTQSVVSCQIYNESFIIVPSIILHSRYTWSRISLIYKVMTLLMSSNAGFL